MGRVEVRVVVEVVMAIFETGRRVIVEDCCTMFLSGPFGAKEHPRANLYSNLGGH